jgi:hypothetical protein
MRGIVSARDIGGIAGAIAGVMKPLVCGWLVVMRSLTFPWCWIGLGGERVVGQWELEGV